LYSEFFKRESPKALTVTQFQYKQHVGAYDSLCPPAATMADAPPDDSSGDTPLLLPNPASNLYATAHDDVLDKVMETIKQKQKILAKIICVPGAKTYVAD
jgi:hypothetical protein